MRISIRKPLRLWPGVVVAILTLAARFGLPVVTPEAAPYGIMGGVVGGLAVILWWLFLSRAPWSERLGAVVLIPLALFAASRIVHVSIATGAQGMLLVMLLAPTSICVAFVAWAAATRHLSDATRRATMVATILLASGVWALVRTDGVTGSYGTQLHWRWTKTPEERLIAKPGNVQRAGATTPLPVVRDAEKTAERPIDKGPGTKSGDKTTVPPLSAAGTVATAAGTEAEWPGFRGPHRDDVIHGIRIKTDWSASPPAALWRRPIGPGWSSFAVRGDLFFTQEQRGSDEVVACYKVVSGELRWAHRDAARFYESNGGPGPRGTPTLNNGCVYALGATGILSALNESDGTVLWSHNAASDAGAKVPMWGCSSSPLAVDDVVIVYAGKLVAYDAVTGRLRWFGPAGGVSYSSPQLMTIGGGVQVVMLSDVGATSVAPADGTQLWQHPWGSTIVQPAQTAEGDLLLCAMNMSGGIGMRRISVARGPDGWKAEERWTSRGLKPYFNDFVVHNGHAFGFDGSILACIDLKDGSRKWKGGRYGNGQLLLLPDQDLLLVVSEEGELALVRATPDQFTELARFPAVEGKTWNHPVLVGDVLLVRNGQEMAAFRLSLEGS